jgi:hypothetical protein
MLQPVHLLASLLSDTPELSVLRNARLWTAIRQHAPLYGVAPLIAEAIRPHASKEQRAWCDRILIDSWQRHSWMLAHLEFVAALLSEAGTPFISLKGPLLAMRYYAPPFLRKPAMDLDIAVKRCDAPRVSQCLLRAGFTLLVPLGEALERSHHLEFVHPSRPKVEIHFRLSHMSMGIPVEEFFDRTALQKLASGREVPVLASSDQLAHLIVHLAQSRFGTLFHRYEIHRICHLETAETIERACRTLMRHGFCGVLKMTDVALNVEWGGRLIPAGLDVPATWLDRRIDDDLFVQFDRWSMPGRQLNVLSRLWGRWLDLQVTDSPSDLWRLFWHLTNSARFGKARRYWFRSKALTYTPSNPEPSDPIRL